MVWIHVWVSIIRNIYKSQKFFSRKSYKYFFLKYKVLKVLCFISLLYQCRSMVLRKQLHNSLIVKTIIQSVHWSRQVSSLFRNNVRKPMYLLYCMPTKAIDVCWLKVKKGNGNWKGLINAVGMKHIIVKKNFHSLFLIS